MQQFVLERGSMNFDILPAFNLKTLHIQEVLSDVSNKLRQHHLTLTTAESCTGGLFSKLLTDQSGSSQYYLGGVIAYNNIIKNRVLAVPLQELEDHGAVSWQVAESMAGGLLKIVTSDLALSFTGIAGPSGGTKAKPVGLVYCSFLSTNALLKEKFTDAIGKISEFFELLGVEVHPTASKLENACNIRILSGNTLLSSENAGELNTRSAIRWVSCLVAFEMLRNSLN
jgi:PncC family amidohydrolase